MSVAYLLAAAEAAAPLAKPIDTPLNLFETLKKSGSFIGQDGKPVDIGALQKQLEGQLTTLTFGFAHCTEYCPYINGALGAMHRHNKTGITSIIIAANPAGDGNEDKGDGATQESRNAFMKSAQNMMKQLKNETDPDYKVVILYPTDASGNLSNMAVPPVANAFGNIVNASDSKKHTPKIALFNSDGTMIANKSPELSNNPDAAKNFVDECVALMNTDTRITRSNVR